MFGLYTVNAISIGVSDSLTLPHSPPRFVDVEDGIARQRAVGVHRSRLVGLKAPSRSVWISRLREKSTLRPSRPEVAVASMSRVVRSPLRTWLTHHGGISSFRSCVFESQRGVPGADAHTLPPPCAIWISFIETV